MHTQNQKRQAYPRTPEGRKRLQEIRQRLKRGDQKKIAETEGVSREAVCKVLGGTITSESILQAAERLIREREEQTN